MKIAVALAFTLLCSCVSSRVVFAPERWEKAKAPDYEDHFDYYALGFFGRAQVDLRTVCMEQKPLAVEHVRTVEDGLITFYTLGIYAPLTVRVWCGN